MQHKHTYEVNAYSCCAADGPAGPTAACGGSSSPFPPKHFIQYISKANAAGFAILAGLATTGRALSK